MLPDVRCQDFHQAGYQWCQGCDRQENSRSSQANGNPEFHPNSWRVNGNLKLFRVDMCSPECWQKDGESYTMQTPEFPTRFGASWQSLHRFAEDHLRTCFHQHGSHELDHGGSLWCSRWHLEGEEGIRSQTERNPRSKAVLWGETPDYVFLKSLRQVAASLSYTSRKNVAQDAQVPTGFITGSYKLYSIY